MCFVGALPRSYFVTRGPSSVGFGQARVEVGHLPKRKHQERCSLGQNRPCMHMHWCISSQLRDGPNLAPRRDVAGHWMGQHTHGLPQHGRVDGSRQRGTSIAELGSGNLVIAFSCRRSSGRRMDRVGCCSGVGLHVLQVARHCSGVTLHICRWRAFGFFAVSSDNTVHADMATTALGTGPSKTSAGVMAASTSNHMPRPQGTTVAIN